MVSDIIGVKQKMQHFTIKCCIFVFYNYYYFVVDFGYSREESVMRHVPDNIFYRKGVFNGNYTANPK